jgi:hypothetical protein
MAQTFVQLQDSVLGDDFDSTKYRTEAKQAINDALDDIARQASLPLLEGSFSPTLVAGTSSYAIPVDEVQITSAFDSDTHNPLRQVTRDWIDDRDDVRGAPYAYAQYGGQIILFPTPDRVYPLTFRYAKEAANVTLDAADVTTVIPDSYAYAVVAFARSWLFAKEEDSVQSDFWLGRYDRALQRIKSDVGRRRPTRQVPGMWASRGGPRFRLP